MIHRFNASRKRSERIAVRCAMMYENLLRSAAAVLVLNSICFLKTGSAELELQGMPAYYYSEVSSV